MPLAVFTSPGPLLFQLGPFSLRWYGLLIAVAVLLGLLLATRLGRQRGIEPALIADLLRMIPGLDVVVADFQAPGHMCSAISTVPAALKDVQRKSVAFCAQHDSDTLVTGFHACQRLLCGLKTTDGLNVVNYVNLLIESMGKTPLPDEYSEWKNAGSPDAIRAKIGSERLAKIGVDFFEQQMLPELRKMPEK